MKKRVLILMLTIVFLVNGCGTEEEEELQEAIETEQEEATQASIETELNLEWGNDEKRKETDAANFRAAKAAFIIQTLDDADDPITLDSSGNYAGYYNMEQGEFVAGDAAAAKASESVGKCSKHKDAYITIKDSQVVWSNDTENCD